MEYFIDFHHSRLEHLSQGGNILMLQMPPWKNRDSRAVAVTFLILPLNFDH
jgi:hypothetical protein